MYIYKYTGMYIIFNFLASKEYRDWFDAWSTLI